MIIALRSLVPREVPKPEKIAHYAQLLRAGSRPPAIKVMAYGTVSDGNGDKRRWLIWDGHTRAAAAWAVGATHIAAEIVSLNG